MSPHLSIRQAFGPTCPSGGSWYACPESSASRFVGCCTTNPCDITCSQGNIRPASFNAASYGKFPDATCGSGSNFFTCVHDDATAPRTFLGCCKSKPCENDAQCPDGDLVPAMLDRPDLFAAYLPEGISIDSMTSTYTSATSLPTTGSMTTSASTIASTTTQALTTVTAAPTGADNHEHKLHNAAVIGGAAGGGVGIAILLGLLFYFMRHIKKSRSHHQEGLERRQSNLNMTPTDKVGIMGSPTMTEAPPVYSSPDPNTDSQGPFQPHSYAYQHARESHFELPASPANHRNTWMPTQQQRTSELLGDTRQNILPSTATQSTPQT